MPSPATIDIESLLAPVAGPQPAGNPQAYAYGLRDKLESLRKEENPEDFDDATRPAELKKADWPGVVTLASDALVSQSKDLRLACHLLEGLVKTKGFAGCRDGLTFIARLCDECWDRLNPAIDDGDLDSRASPLANMLDDAERGMRFPVTLRQVPLIGAADSGIGLVKWNRLRASTDPALQETLSKTLANTSPDELQCKVDDLGECLAGLAKLETVLESKLAASAPSFTYLKAALADCQKLASQELARLRPPVTPAATNGGLATISGGLAGGPITSRSEAYQQLNRVAEVLQQLEPHSPIPYFVKRAVTLGQLPFPLMIERLIRDSNVLTELNRELGLDSQTTAQAT